MTTVKLSPGLRALLAISRTPRTRKSTVMTAMSCMASQAVSASSCGRNQAQCDDITRGEG